MKIPQIEYKHFTTKVYNYIDLNKRLLKILAKQIKKERIKRNLSPSYKAYSTLLYSFIIN